MGGIICVSDLHTVSTKSPIVIELVMTIQNISGARSAARTKANVLGVGIDAIDMEMAVARLIAAAGYGEKGYVCVTGVHGVMEAQKSPSFRRILNAAMLNTPDGMPMVWVGKTQGHDRIARVYGPDLMLEVCRRTVETGHTHFFYGGVAGVAELLRDRLCTRFPGLRVVGTFTPPFRCLHEGEEKALIDRVGMCQPDFFWVGLSTPKQERFMEEYISRLETKVMLGVGAAFDMHSGRTKQAPNWMQRSGLEWSYRLCQEPRRLYKRYMSNNPRFLINVALQLAGLRTYELS